MIICMPTVGQKVRVLDGLDWTFKLYQERRNESLYAYFGKSLTPDHRRSFWEDYVGGEAGFRKARAEGRAPELKSIEVTLPEGTELTIDRIYIRKGAGDFDSISFILNGARVAGKVGAQARVRFWVKLEDVNTGRLEMLP